ncbi:MAG: YggS family pyridoxal phosphate-dependent enzyme [Gammaproteobacteria bacterium]|nr:MAG: YggS family pyridoxal phosphate-dependent enzyme [Gammaproteobacteria bacterium]
MKTIALRLKSLRDRILDAERLHGRPPGSVALLAVSKTRSAEEIRAARAAGQLRFGENYLQEAMVKMDTLADLDLEWHFIGPIQSNKTREIAARFAWVHSVDRLKIAQRLSATRPPELPPLNVCIQVNIGDESSKSGINLAQLPELAQEIGRLPRLKLRGLMTMPRLTEDQAEQRRQFRDLREGYDRLKAVGNSLDTLSMGTSADLEAAIAEGATIVRVGTDVFGERGADRLA